MIYVFIAERCSDLPIGQCCRTMKVSRSAFYAWRHRQVNPTARMLADVDLGDLIVKIHDQSFGTYGALRVTRSCVSVLDARSTTNGCSA